MSPPKFIPIFILLSASIQSDPVIGLKANINNQPLIWTKLGQDVELLCTSGTQSIQSLAICRWTRTSLADPGNRTIVLNFSKDALSGPVTSGNYSYLGSGMANGECGLKIHEISEEQTGTWGCTLNGQDIWIGDIQVALYEKPHSPAIQVNTIENLIDKGDGVNSTVLCCVDGGKPVDEATLSMTFFYEGKEVHSRLHKFPGDVPCIEWYKNFTTEDNGKKLKCVVDHPGYSNTDVKEDEVTIDVKFPPKFMDVDEGLVIELLEGDEYGNFTFSVKGYPQPEITLHPEIDVDGVPKFAGFDSYCVNMTKIVGWKGDEYEFQVNVTINQPKPGNFTYILRASNPYGYKQIDVTIVSPAPGDEGSSTFWILVTVGIVMSILFVAIIVCTLNTVAKTKGWGCYQNRTRKYPVTKQKTDNSDVNEYFTVPRNDTIDEEIRL